MIFYQKTYVVHVLYFIFILLGRQLLTISCINCIYNKKINLMLIMMNNKWNSLRAIYNDKLSKGNNICV